MLFCFVGFTPPPPAKNQEQNALSPSGKFVLKLPIEPQEINPAYKGTKVWKVTICSPNGEILYKDEESTMVGSLNVYWGWGLHDVVWVWNSDDGRTWRWEETERGWQKTESEHGIPEWILPEYIRDEKNTVSTSPT